MSHLLLSEGTATPIALPNQLQATTVTYPSSGTVPAGILTAFGNYSAPDTTVTKVELLQYGVVVQANNAPTAKRGAWSADFTNVAVGTDYQIKVYGDVTTTTGGSFDVV